VARASMRWIYQGSFSLASYGPCCFTHLEKCGPPAFEVQFLGPEELGPPKIIGLRFGQNFTRFNSRPLVSFSA